MATDERNFRSTYYEKVGFRSVEERKSLEILLKDKPLDKQKLKQFCLRFTVPGIYRNRLWKILLAMNEIPWNNRRWDDLKTRLLTEVFGDGHLKYNRGVIPIYVDSHQFVMSQRQQEYRDLEQALKVMRITDHNVNPSQRFYAMWCLETGKINYDFNIQQENGFVAISNILLELYENVVDIYWLTKGFYNIVGQYRQEIPSLIDRTKMLLEKEDDELFKHLMDIDSMKIIPFESWFESCFAGVINETSLAKVWDKLCGGSFKILVFVALALLTTLQRTLIRCTDSTSVFQCFTNISEEFADVIVNKAIEVWQQNGCALTLQQPESILTSKIKI